MEEQRKLLIVEDEVLVRCGLKSVIDWDKLGMTIVGDAANGKQALEIYERERPDIILTDIKMPVMDGLEMISRIREKDQKTKIVILTCYEEFRYLQDAMRMGVSDYILKLTMKPSEIESLMEKLKRELDEKEQNQQIDAKSNALRKEELFKEYIFYHHIPIELFRKRMAKLHPEIHEKNTVLLRMVLKKYEDIQARIMDSKGMLVRFTILNIVGELLEEYEKNELICEKEDAYLVLVNLEENKTPEENRRKLNQMTSRISEMLSFYVNAETVWEISSATDSWEMLPKLYQECCQALDNRVQVSVEIYEAIRYIKEHLSEKLTLNQVASHIGLSPNYLSSQFKKELGKSFVDYITECRVDKAKELLMSTDMKSHEVAEATGFIDNSYFSKTFKKITGKRPSAFRKRDKA